MTLMKTTTKTQADLDNEALDAEMTESEKEWWRAAGEDEKKKAG